MNVSRVFLFGFATFLIFTVTPPCLHAGSSDKYWRVDDIRPGMKGTGKTVIKGTKVETFHAEVLGVMKNTSPGRDMILCRLSGCQLEKSGVIAGMSGSPVYIDGKLLGAVAYAWQFGKEPIAGVTPFVQMQRYAGDVEKNHLVERKRPRRISLRRPIGAAGKKYASVTVSDSFDQAKPTSADGLWLTPLRTPLVATGFSKHSLWLLQQKLAGSGMVPVQGGGAGAYVMARAKNVALEPGGALTIAMIQGDFDLSGIGTVTHIEGKRVWGWGHPFMSLGKCELPLMTGWVHTIYPRQSLSFKMGSPLRTVGVINADVSTCIAGRLGQKPDLLPVRMTVQLDDAKANTFNVRVVRERSLLPSLVYTAMTNSVDMEGTLPEELTATVRARIEIAGRKPIVVDDVFSGSSVSAKRAPRTLYGPISEVLETLTHNNVGQLRIERITCTTHLQSGRNTAKIESVELDSTAYRPGATLKAKVYLKPWDGPRRHVTVTMKLPTDIDEGTHTLYIGDDVDRARRQIRDHPNLSRPRTTTQLLQAVKIRTGVQRTHLVLRLPRAGGGVALHGKTFTKLPSSMVHILANGRRTGARTLSNPLVVRQPTKWVIEGAESLRFRVSRRQGTSVKAVD